MTPLNLPTWTFLPPLDQDWHPDESACRAWGRPAWCLQAWPTSTPSRRRNDSFGAGTASWRLAPTVWMHPAWTSHWASCSNHLNSWAWQASAQLVLGTWGQLVKVECESFLLSLASRWSNLSNKCRNLKSSKLIKLRKWCILILAAVELYGARYWYQFWKTGSDLTFEIIFAHREALCICPLKSSRDAASHLISLMHEIKLLRKIYNDSRCPLSQEANNLPLRVVSSNIDHRQYLSISKFKVIKKIKDVEFCLENSTYTLESTIPDSVNFVLEFRTTPLNHGYRSWR